MKVGNYECVGTSAMYTNSQAKMFAHYPVSSRSI